MYNFKILSCFKKQAKPLTKKFPNFKKDLLKFLNNLSLDNAINLGRGNYKLRLKLSDLPKGKNKSLRLIIHVIYQKNLIIPIAVYCKSEKENISKLEINNNLLLAIEELKKI